MIEIDTFIEKRILKLVNRDNYMIRKKATMLCKCNVFFLAFLLFIITPVHCLDFERHPILVIGDILVVFGLIISILILKKGNLFSAGMCTVIAFMMIPIVHNLIGDWLFPTNITATRYFETVVMLCFLFTLIIIYSTNKWQIIVGALLSVPVIWGHFFVLKDVVRVDIPYTYLLYVLLPVAMGIMAAINLQLVNDAIDSLITSKSQVSEWNKMLEETVEQRTKELVESNNKLEAISNTDALTGIGNRRYFDNALVTGWSWAQRTTSHLAMIIGDVDWFKNYNDIYGHLAGDECLCLVAKAFQDNAKRESDLVARYGGEEFAAIFPVISTEQATIFAQRLICRFHEMKLPHSGSQFGYVTISLGIAVINPQANQAVEDLVKAADAALYMAKNKGRNQYVLWDKEIMSKRCHNLMF